jgi:hypothetical protein
MKLSDNTLSILKNFASINSGLVVQRGRVQKTINPEQTIFVEATIEDNMPEKFGIYDLNQFLGNVVTLNNPDLTFTSESVLMDDGEIKLNYYSCSTNLVISPPEGRELVMKDDDVEFSITSASLQKLLKIASMNSLPNVSVQGKDGGLYFRTHELKNDTSNYASIRIGDYDGDDFSVSFKAENLRLIPDDYDVRIKIGGFSCWVNRKETLKYFIAMEKK